MTKLDGSMEKPTHKRKTRENKDSVWSTAQIKERSEKTRWLYGETTQKKQKALKQDFNQEHSANQKKN